MSLATFDLDVQIKRDSILSEYRAKDESEEKRKRLEAAPPDPYHLVHLVFFFLGMSSWIPLMFFLTAQDFWMYKFRDTSQANYDLNNKTVLQQNFTSMQSLITTIPALIINLLCNRYGHRITIQKRLMTTSLILFVTFLVFTGFVKIDTDSWQLGFFIMTMAFVTILSMNNAVLTVTSFSLISRFPSSYLKTNQYGSNMIGLISAILQILCLATNGTPTTVALIYFAFGTFLISVNVALMFFAFKLPRFIYFLGDAKQDMTRPTQNMSQFLNVARKMWPIAFTTITGMALFDLSGPALTSMIVSEQYPGTLWSRKYFIPVVNFLVVNIMALLACALSGPYITPRNARYFVVFDICRQIFVGPLTIFCNLKTTNRHLPTLFPHDYQYIIIITLFNFFFNLSVTCGLLSTPNLMSEDPEQGFLFMTTVTAIISPLISPLASVWVNSV